MKAKDIMSQDVATVKGSATVADAVRLMRLKEVRSLVVEPRNDEDAYGIVTESDIVGKVIGQGKNPKEVRIFEVMTKPCVVVNPDLNIEYVARLFANTGIKRAPVIQGELLGIISETDILVQGDFLENPRVAILERELQKAISAARELSANPSTTPEESDRAWEGVDAIEAEIAFLKAKPLDKTAREQFDAPQSELATVG